MPLEDLIKQQLDTNKATNLLFENASQIMDIEPDFLAALEELLADSNPKLFQPELVSFAAQELIKRLYFINPYLQISEKQVEKLERVYRRTWKAMRKTREVRATLKKFHYPELSKWLASLYPERFQKSLRQSPMIGSVTYGEYSAELQVELLGIDIAHIKQPILDIGCGSQANLARYFHAQGIEIYGIDRHLEVQEPYLEEVDWFRYSFQPNIWGTIIANMSFTNHLNYAYRHDHIQLEHYLLKMKEIIESLSVRGCFHYAPGLPFVEDQLPAEKYKVEREQKVNDIFVARIIRIGEKEQ